eukprot:SAG11_NODE_8273_length_1036_cov_2.138741_2_plen_57_part_00
MVVVCAGVKSILDVPRTLEFLESAVRRLSKLFPHPLMTIKATHAPYSIVHATLCLL